MKIRIADLDKDAGDIMSAAEDFVRRMDYVAFLPEREEDFVKAIASVVTANYVETVVAEHENRIVGAIGVAYLPNMWNPEALTAEEIYWWVDKSAPLATAIRLLRFTMSRAKEKGVKFAVFRKLTSSPEKLANVYRKMGFSELETSYIRPM